MCRQTESYYPRCQRTPSAPTRSFWDTFVRMVAAEAAEKTRQLLFRGAQAYMDHVWDEGVPESCAIVHLPESPQPGPMGVPGVSRGQLLIGPGGRLVRSRAQACEADPSMTVSRACSSCIRSVDGKAVCSQCERPLCGRCLRTCWGCGTGACSSCAIVDCSDIHEKTLCPGCAVFEA
ncbi:apoptosis regulatory protein Siva isoform X2 [Tamandua tetradactyla]|uniref:apoptosis regulatory protein Siva isoform X2 n=1 Tax=Tamandua tetradactyla TaxID=48850 RepID=UPI0040537F88